MLESQLYVVLWHLSETDCQIFIKPVQLLHFSPYHMYLKYILLLFNVKVIGVSSLALIPSCFIHSWQKQRK